MTDDAARLYHILIRWPAEDDDGPDPVARSLAESGGEVLVPGLDRLYGFATAWQRDLALRRAERDHGAGCVAPLGIIAEAEMRVGCGPAGRGGTLGAST